MQVGLLHILASLWREGGGERKGERDIGKKGGSPRGEEPHSPSPPGLCFRELPILQFSLTLLPAAKKRDQFQRNARQSTHVCVCVCVCVCVSFLCFFFF